MKNPVLTLFVVLLGLLFFSPPSASPQILPVAPPALPGVHALIVGINDYAVGALPYAKNDAMDFEKILLSSGADKGNILTLYNREATKENFLQKLGDLSKNCLESDALILFYSGHSSTVKDKNGDEKDGIDEGLILVDSDGQNVFLSDDEIDKTLAECKAGLVWLILDCDHSGGIIADDEKNPRKIISASCKSTELCFEASSLRHGVFSAFLLQALSSDAPKVDLNADGTLSFNEIHQYVSSKVPTYNVNIIQHPTFYEGAYVKDLGIFKLNKDGSLSLNIPNLAPSALETLVSKTVASIEKAGASTDPKYNLEIKCYKPVFYPDDSIQFSLDINDKAYLYLINIYEGDQVSLISPNSTFKNNLAKPGKLSTTDIIGQGNSLDVLPGSKKGDEFFFVIVSPVKLTLESLFEKKSSAEIYGLLNKPADIDGKLAKISDSIANSLKTVAKKDKVAAKSPACAVLKYSVESELPDPWIKIFEKESTVGIGGIIDPKVQPKIFSIRSPLYIMKNEVTVENFEKFMRMGGYDKKDLWSDAGYKWLVENKRVAPDRWKDQWPQHPLWPVTGVTYYEAGAYAKWAGGRLPTEIEWEAALRGNTGKIYPWGNNWMEGQCNCGDLDVRHPVNVGSYPSFGTTEGVQDMLGNAWEWTSEVFEDYPAYPLPQNYHKDMHVLRGGSYQVREWYGFKILPASRYFVEPSYSQFDVSFRVVRDFK